MEEQVKDIGGFNSCRVQNYLKQISQDALIYCSIHQFWLNPDSSEMKKSMILKQGVIFKTSISKASICRPKVMIYP